MDFDSFTDAVGYQLEKVHTGVIAWFLDLRNPHVTREDQTAVLSGLLDEEFVAGDIAELRCWRESKAGKRKLDLATSVKTQDREWSIAWEAKVDTDVVQGQLADIEATFDWGTGPGDRRFILLLLGASQNTWQHQDLGKFRVVDLDRALAIFNPLRGRHPILEDWVASLSRERDRISCAFPRFAESGGDLASLCALHGYRVRPTWYVFYGHLREALTSRQQRTWAIYNGTHNPVMNWNNGWLRLSPSGDLSPTEHHPDAFYATPSSPPVEKSTLVQLYWEFNYSDLILKAGYENCQTAEWEVVRQRISAILDSATSSPARRGSQGLRWGEGWKSLTLAVWTFDFHLEVPEGLASRVNAILDDIHPRLQELNIR